MILPTVSAIVEITTGVTGVTGVDSVLLVATVLTLTVEIELALALLLLLLLLLLLPLLLAGCELAAAAVGILAVEIGVLEPILADVTVVDELGTFDFEGATAGFA